ncbi:unnamed protein product [Calicophoron daubneyi]|uniref:Tetraspanin n=1 Tax=Calicophoron daubneyi TaxID=300641 RepID=A0AAV2TLD6_CALDB
MTTEGSSAVRKPLMRYGDTVVQDDSRKCCSCTPSWVKTFLIFFTSIIMLIALGLIGLGIYLFVVRYSFLPSLLGEVAYLTHFLLFVVGVLLIVACIIGFVGASNGKSKYLLGYAWLLTGILLLQLTTGILALCYSQFFQQWLAGNLRHTMQNSYGIGDPQVVEAVDIVQQKFKCCGSETYHDWRASMFQNSSEAETVGPEDPFSYGMRVPDSCCIRSSNRIVQNCGALPHPSNVFHQGCMPAIFTRLRDRYYIICVVTLSLVFVELFGVVLSCCYSKTPKGLR